MPMITLPERFWAKVNKTDTCWLWTGATRSQNYGSFLYGNKMESAHRLAYRAFKGKINNTVDHTCFNTLCVNPDHLEDVTQSEQQRRRYAHYPKPTHCPHGHEYTPENTGEQKTGRRCLTCYRRAKRDWARRNR